MGSNFKSTFHIPHMDCSAEEQLVKMKLAKFGNIKSLSFDLENRKLEIIHEDAISDITKSLSELNLGAELSETIVSKNEIIKSPASEKTALIIVLLINLFFFGLELTTGFISNSMGLVADSIDMFADVIIYGLSLLVISGSIIAQKRIALVSGILQLILAISGFAEVIRRVIVNEEIPTPQIMIFISIFALFGNAASMFILQKTKSTGAHIKASIIFTSTDVIVNIGVIIAGITVYVTSSRFPDLIVGSIVFLLVIRGAFKILHLRN